MLIEAGNVLLPLFEEGVHLTQQSLHFLVLALHANK
jgi:hypothetical protein